MRNRFVNSTTLLLAAYFIVHFVKLGSEYLILKVLGIKDVVMYFFSNSYVTPSSSWWSSQKVFLAFCGPILMVFIFLIVVIVLKLELHRKYYSLRLFYNWIIIVAVAFILSAIFSVPFFNEASPAYHLLVELGFQPDGKGATIMSIILLPIIPFVSYLTKGTFLKMTNTTKWIKTKQLRMKLFFSTAIFPLFLLFVVLYNLIYTWYSYPMLNAGINEGMRLLVIIIILIFGAFFSYNNKYVAIQRSNRLHLLNLPLSALVFVAISGIYVILWLNLT